jgi:hypothetical protein
MKKRNRYYYTNNRLRSLTIDDYLNVLENVEEHSRKYDNVTYKARCPLHHNHAHGDNTIKTNRKLSSSFIISKGDKGQEVVYTCMSQGGPKGLCNQKALTSWFIKKFKELKLLTNRLRPEWPSNHGRA